MNKIFFILLLVIIIPSGCNLREQEKKLEEREARLNQKEQELILKEKTLTLKEEDILKREQKLDSNSLDSVIINPAIVGRWSVQMTCTETTCSGSAVGDTRTEQWEISYQSNHIIAKVFENEKLSRIYTGIYTGNTIELIENVNATSTQPATKIIIRLRIVDNTKMEGQREIERGTECKIIYSMQLEKKS